MSNIFKKLSKVFNTKTTSIEDYRGLRAFHEGGYVGTVISKYDGYNLPSRYVRNLIDDFGFEYRYIKSEKWVILKKGTEIFPNVIDELEFK